MFFGMPEDCNRYDIWSLANQIEFTLRHLSRGPYPCARKSTFPTNRLLVVTANANGAGNSISDADSEHRLVPGELYFVPAFLPATYRLDDGLRFVSVHFTLELYRGVDLFSRAGRMHSEAAPGLAERISGWFDTPDRLAAALDMKRTILDVALALLSRYGEEPLTLAGRFAPYRKVLDHIAMHCTAATTVEELAAVMHMPREVFSRKFSADIGLPAKKFFDRQLAARAASLLREPGVTVREVADRLEFSSEYAFSRFFRSKFGLPPGLYQRQGRF